MQKGKKKVTITLLILIILCISISLSQYRYPCVRQGITMSKARERVDTQEGYFIVTQQQGNTGARFMIAYGDNKGTEVELGGNDPGRYLSRIFLLSKTNFFLVYGKEQNVSNLGMSISDGMDLSDMYTINVTDWEPIIPIRRDYQYKEKVRWFYPLWCIDTFDVMNGDYENEM